MGKDEKQDVLELYFETKYFEHALEKNQEYLKKEGYDLEFFEKYCATKLNSLEKTILKKRQIDKKSLKKIAKEIDYSYGYTRRVYMDSKQKMNIVFSMNKGLKSNSKLITETSNKVSNKSFKTKSREIKKK